MNQMFYKPNLRLSLRLLILAGILLMGFNALYAQKVHVYSGTVTSPKGETLPGVNVLVKGTTIGSVTDISGKFSFNADQALETLVFSFVGYQSKEVPAKAGVPLTVVLEETSINLNELVIVGYGTQKKSVVTGAITSVKAKDLENMQISRIEQAMQGRTSGITITASSGQPGSASTVRVRGTTSINDSDPLYVVDGVPVDVGGIDYLNASDIESIEVLKDAASAAIYGARAASGVILVTTKKGKSGAMRVNYDAYFGTQAPAKKLDLCSASEYAMLRNEASVNGGGSIIFPDPESYGTGTDWQSQIFNDNAGIQNHELSISGGSDRSTYFTSFGYFDQEGIVATEISHYKRLNLRFNSTHKIKPWLVFGNNFGYSHIKSKGSLNTNSEFGGPLASAINLDPITPVIITDPDEANKPPYSNQPVMRDPDGNPYAISKYVGQEMSNPMAYIATQLGNYGWSDNFVGNVYAELEPIKGLKLRSDLGTKLAFWGNESFTPIFYLTSYTTNPNTSFYRSMSTGLIWNLENTASYSRSFGKHNVTGLLGTSAYVGNSKNNNSLYKNLPVSTFEEASMNYDRPAADRIAGGWEAADHRVSSIFARLTYNYDEKYLFTGIIRRDGSSRFGINNKFGYFPSASFGWVASREGFWPQNDVLTFLKIRGSYGVTGNDNIGDFQYVSTVSGGRNYTFGNDQYIIGVSPNAPANPDLKWEETSQSNIGFEATIMENISVVFDLYSKNTTGMLQPIILPLFMGASNNPTGNVASMTNKGVELELGYRKIIGDLSIDVRANGAYLKNEITDLGEVKFRTGATFQASQYEISRLTVGHPVGAFYGFQTLGIFKKQSEILGYTDPVTGTPIQPNAKVGDFKFADINGDGKITGDDRTFIGDPTPTWTYGFTASASYKNFDILIFGQGVAGNDIFNATRRLDIPTANWMKESLNRWTLENPYSDYPRLVVGDPNKNFANPSTFYLTSGAYFRIKTMQIGYSLPKSLLAKSGFTKARLYVSSNNLLTLTKYNGFDPEIGGGSFGIDRGVYPQARSFLVGVNIGF